MLQFMQGAGRKEPGSVSAQVHEEPVFNPCSDAPRELVKDMLVQEHPAQPAEDEVLGSDPHSSVPFLREEVHADVCKLAAWLRPRLWLAHDS